MLFCPNQSIRLGRVMDLTIIKSQPAKQFMRNMAVSVLSGKRRGAVIPRCGSYHVSNNALKKVTNLSMTNLSSNSEALAQKDWRLFTEDLM